MKQPVGGNEATESLEDKQKVLLFFKCYLRYLKQTISRTSSGREENSSVFDLKKTGGNVSLEAFLQSTFLLEFRSVIILQVRGRGLHLRPCFHRQAG